MNRRQLLFILKFRNEASKALTAFQAQLARTAASVGGLAARLSTGGQALARFATRAALAAKALQGVGQQAQAIGTTLLGRVTLPLAAAAVAAVKASADFEQAFAGVRKTTNLSVGDLENLRGRFTALADTIPFSTVQLANIAEAAGQLGITGVDNLEKFTLVAAKLETTTGIAADQVASQLARFSNIIGEPRENVERLGSSLTALGNEFESVESEVLDAGIRLAGAARIIGLTSGQTLGFASALGSVGVRAEAGGTALSKVFQDISNAVAKGSSEVALFAQTAGLSTQEFARLFQTDAAEAILRFIEGLDSVTRSGGNTIALLEALGITEARQTRIVLSLAGAHDSLRRSVTRGNEAFQENTALEEEFQIFANTLTNRLKTLRNQILNTAAAFGDAFRPEIDKLIMRASEFVAKMRDIATQLKNADARTRALIVRIATFTALLGPALIAFGTLARVVGFAATGIANFGRVIASLAPIIARVLPRLLGPWGLVATAIGGATTALFKYRDAVLELGEGRQATALDLVVGIFETAADRIREGGQKVLDLVQFVVNGIGGIFSDLNIDIGPIIKDVFVFLAESAKDGANALILAFQVAFSIIKTGFKIVGGLAGDVLGGIAAAARLVFERRFGELLDLDIFSTAWDNAAKATKEGVAEVSAILDDDPLGKFFQDSADRAAKRYKERLRTEIPKGIGGGVKDGVDKIEPALRKGGTESGEAFAENFATAFTRGFNKAMVDFIRQAQDASAQGEKLFTEAFGGAKDALLDFLETGEFKFQDFARSILRTINEITIDRFVASLLTGAGVGEAAPGVAQGEGFFGRFLTSFLGGAPTIAETGKAAPVGTLPAAGRGAASSQAAATIIGAGTSDALKEANQIVADQTRDVERAVTDGTAKQVEATMGLGAVFESAIGRLQSGITSLFNTLAGLGRSVGEGIGATIQLVQAGLGAVGSFAGSFGEPSQAELARIPAPATADIRHNVGAFGGIAGLSMGMGVSPRSRFMAARRFRHGGRSDRIPAMLRPGEAVVPLRGGAIPVTLGDDAQGGAGRNVQVTVNFNFPAGTNFEAFKQNQQQIAGTLARRVSRSLRRDT